MVPSGAERGRLSALEGDAGPPAAAAVILPALNEARHIGALLSYLTAGDWVADHIVVADGGSTDGTREIVAAFAATDPRVSLLHNPKRLQSAGVNLAVAGLPPSVQAFVRMDVHASYPAGFVARTLGSLRRSGAASVVVRLHTVSETHFQRAVAEACNGVLGTGGAAHRVARASGFVDHGHHAAFLRTPFEQVGGYDEAFATNEDAELDARLAAAGWRIWMEGDVAVNYLPRRSLPALVRQYFRYGMGRSQNIRKNRLKPRLRQMMPAVLTVIIAASLVSAPFWPVALLVPASYLIAVAGAAVVLMLRRGDLSMVGLAAVLPAIHLSWGSGFLWSSLRAVRIFSLHPASRSGRRAVTG